MVHRDVKPSNLMIDRAGHVWLTDFGLASLGDAHTALTETGQVVGTPHYMSPEQAAGDERIVDRRSDIYSLGATLYELATGQRPYRGDRLRILMEISIGRLTPPSQVRPDIPRRLEAIILKAMAYAADDRYASAAEMAAELRRFVSGQETIARRPNVADRTIRWVLANPKTSLGVVGGVAACVLLAIGIQYGVTRRLSTINQRLEATNETLAATNRDLDRSRTELQRHLYVADLAAAYQAYGQRDLDAVHQLLGRHVVEEEHGVDGSPQTDGSPLTLALG